MYLPRRKRYYPLVVFVVLLVAMVGRYSANETKSGLLQGFLEVENRFWQRYGIYFALIE
jgi:hypothetical protein